MDKDHLLTAARYVELTHVRTGLVQAPSRYRWSSAAAHLRGRVDALVQVAPLLQMAPNWRRLFTSYWALSVQYGPGPYAIPNRLIEGESRFWRWPRNSSSPGRERRHRRSSSRNSAPRKD